MSPRDLSWDGCANVREMGGLPLVGGGVLPRGRWVRGDHPRALSAAGWRALQAHGVGTVIELFTAGQQHRRRPDVAERPPELSNRRVAVEDIADPEFVARWVETHLWCTPLFFEDTLRRWPERQLAVARAVLAAPPGGVLIHCARGRDRTGLVSLVLGSLVGVEPRALAQDYALSWREGSCAPEAMARERAVLDRAMAEQRTTMEAVIIDFLERVDVVGLLTGAGMTEAELAALRGRLLG